VRQEPTQAGMDQGSRVATNGDLYFLAQSLSSAADFR
jgi:hypothetical protein